MDDYKWNIHMRILTFREIFLFLPVVALVYLTLYFLYMSCHIKWDIVSSTGWIAISKVSVFTRDRVFAVEISCVCLISLYYKTIQKRKVLFNFFIINRTNSWMLLSDMWNSVWSALLLFKNRKHSFRNRFQNSFKRDCKYWLKLISAPIFSS